jgi:hypothetical protein
MRIHRVGPDISVLNDSITVPGIGFLAVNAFVLRAAEPVVVDTGLGIADRDFVSALGSVVDPQDVRWIWLTHPDRDHTGGLFDLLEAAPRARVVTTFLSMGLLSCERPLPVDRVYLLNPGQELDVGDRTLHAFRPPLFDNPSTMGFHDDRSGVSFTSDCFGAVMPSTDSAGAEDVRAIADEDLRAAQLMWAAVDSPWVHLVDEKAYLDSFRPLREADPEVVLSSHLPPAPGLGGAFLDTLARAPGTDPFVGPDQRALEELLAGFEPGGTPS